VRANGHELDVGDGLACSGEAAVDLEGLGDAELLLFDLA
jgi:hypothetical protein